MEQFTPLRYPGGKAKLSPFMEMVLEANKLLDGDYAEPYAGGAGMALSLLFRDYVGKIHLNDISQPIYAFWKSVTSQSDEFIKLLQHTPVTAETWHEQKAIQKNPDAYSTLQLGFSTFFLNRTNRSGIVNAGMIGGKDQSGPWKIDARYNVDKLCERIDRLSRYRGRIKVYRMDAIKFIDKVVNKLPEKSLVYLDPPYYHKGQHLYTNFYKHEDHEEIAEKVLTSIQIPWVVSYDAASPILKMYPKVRRILYQIGYSAASRKDGNEVLFFSPGLKIARNIEPLKIQK